MTSSRTSLTGDDRRRFSRHLLLPEIGEAGQERLKCASVFVAGAGGLGSPVLLYLAAAGVGRIGIADHDVVDESNLQRQVIHATPDAGRKKVEVARERITALNPGVDVRVHPERLEASNAREIIAAYDLVVDGTDNFPARYLLNDTAFFLGLPLVYGAVYRFEGQASVFDPARGGPCYRCLHPAPPAPGAAPSCAEAGVLGVVPGLVGLVQAAEALKILLGIGSTLAGRILLADALSMRFRDVKLAKNPACPLCGSHPSIREIRDEGATCSPGAPGANEGGTMAIPKITVKELKKRWEKGDRPALLDVREPAEYDRAHLGGTLIPLGELEDRVGELDPKREWVVHCKAGGRSSRAVVFLMSKGFADVKNLEGGIMAWRAEIDPSLPES